MEAVHLVRRFFASLRHQTPRAAEEAWLLAMLSPAEAELYRRQPAIDRHHSVNCALAAREQLGARASRAVIVASALHDVGKADTDLATFGRVGATVAGKVVPASRLCAWEAQPGLRGRMARYAHHDKRGARMLMDAGSHPMVVAWAQEHHEPAASWSIDPAIAQVLFDADH